MHRSLIRSSPTSFRRPSRRTTTWWRPTRRATRSPTPGRARLRLVRNGFGNPPETFDWFHPHISGDPTSVTRRRATFITVQVDVSDGTWTVRCLYQGRGGEASLLPRPVRTEKATDFLTWRGPALPRCATAPARDGVARLPVMSVHVFDADTALKDLGGDARRAALRSVDVAPLVDCARAQRRLRRGGAAASDDGGGRRRGSAARSLTIHYPPLPAKGRARSRRASNARDAR